VADDQGAQVVRVSPRTNRVVARIDAGDGPASMAFDGNGAAWVINHRDTTIDRIDLATNRSTRLARLGGDAPERMVWLAGSLWVTGRGTDLLQVSTADGSVERTIEIGGSGIDLVAAGNTLWVATRSVEVDAAGFPSMDALVHVALPAGEASTVSRPTGRLDVHGLTVANGAVWIADNRRGYVYRVPAG
jgi:streptogramin lyase